MPVLKPTSPAGFDEYLAGRREWNERYGSHITQAKQWRSVALVAMGVSVCAVLGIVILASQSRIIPYVIEVDGKSRPIQSYPADQIPAPSATIEKATLARWLIDWRTVTSDPELQKKAATSVYAHLGANSQAYNQLTAWYRENNPFERASKLTVRAEVNNILTVSSTSWRIQWVEYHQDRLANNPPTTLSFTAVLTTTYGQVDETQLLNNPIALFVTSLDWSQDAFTGAPG